MTGPVARAHGR